MKTLVIQTAFPGDVVLTLPLLQSLARSGDQVKFITHNCKGVTKKYHAILVKSQL